MGDTVAQYVRRPGYAPRAPAPPGDTPLPYPFPPALVPPERVGMPE